MKQARYRKMNIAGSNSYAGVKRKTDLIKAGRIVVTRG